jgi:short-subunit dehydrogenase
VPDWLDRGRGYFVGVASAAGLVHQIDGADYSVTKDIAVDFAE